MNIQIPYLSDVETVFDRYFAEGNFHEIIVEANQLLAQSLAQENMTSAMNAYLNLALAHFYLGQIENAFSQTLHYKKLCEAYGNPRDKYYLYIINAYIYEYEGDFQKAKEALETCMDIARKHEAYDDLCSSLNLYSHILLLLGETTEALQFALETKNLAAIHCPSDLSIHFQHNLIIAASQIELGYYNEATIVINQLALHPVCLQNTHFHNRFTFVQAMYYLRTGAFEQALAVFQVAEKQASELNNQLMLKRISLHCVDIYESLGDYKAGLCQMKKYVHIKEELHRIRLTSKLEELNLKHSIDIVEHRANTDSLSGVYNRYYLEKKTNTWLEQAKTTSDHVCCLVFDVDNFKSINDNYGHLFGDEVIKMIGATCNKLLHKKDTIIARYGGDEFIIILKNYGREHITNFAHSIFEALTTTSVQLDEQSLRISLSMGIVCNDSVPAKRFTQLFQVADQALYLAKRQGKNQIVSMSNTNFPI